MAKRYPFVPDWTIPPGEHMEEELECRGIGRPAFAAAMGLSLADADSLLTGKAPVTKKLAPKLEALLGPSAQFWLNLEANHTAALKRLGRKRGERK